MPDHAAKPSPHRLTTIDALRGFAALGVVLFHCSGRLASPSGEGLLGLVHRAVTYLLSFGNAGVWLFFVISGFCIHLRYAKSRASGASGSVDFLSFWRRRVVRLYPAYLAALVVYMMVLGMEGRLGWNGRLGYDVFLHLTMLYNLDVTTVYSFNGVFWTLAIEEQLYALYFVLLGLRRRYSWTMVLGLCLATRLAWYAVCLVVYRAAGLQLPAHESALAHWFTWALGAFAIEAALGIVRAPEAFRDFRLAMVFVLAAMGLQTAMRSIEPTALLFDLMELALYPIWGVGAFIVVNWLVHAEHSGPSRLLESSWLTRFAKLGAFSYSLYLTHELVVLHGARYLHETHGVELTAWVLALLVTGSIVFAWCFFRLFERPFLRPRVVAPAESTTALRPLAERVPAG